MREGKELSDEECTLTLKGIDNIINKEDSASEKTRLTNLKQKIASSRDSRNLKILTCDQQKWLQLIKEAYNELVAAKQQLESSQKQFNVTEHLLTIIPELDITKEALNFNNIHSKISSKNLKLKNVIPKDFLNQWRVLSKEVQVREEAAKIQREKQREKQKQKIRQEELRIKRETEERQKEYERIEREKLAEKQRLKKEQEQRRGKRGQRQARGKWILLEKYVEARGDIIVDKGKNKQLCEYLGGRLEMFLKKTLQKVHDIACLKNKKNPTWGNELGYFGVDQERTNPQAGYFIQPSSKIYCLTYKHKLEIYSNLRNRQFAKEEAIREDLENKAGESQRKMERKLENYLLRPRGADVEPPGEWREEVDYTKSSTAVHITFEHLIEYLETHPFLRNSLLLFSAYHT